jgi:hypothetical protein
MALYKITTGDGKGHYMPNDSITREQMAVFLWKLAGKPSVTKSVPDLSDIGSLKGDMKKAVEWLASTGITVGDGKGHYMPKDFVTRAQMAVFMNKLANVLKSY